MAKKTRTKKAAPATGDMTTYSTRLSAEQGKVVEEAASLLGASAAKFIRDAAVARAVDVLNASGKNQPTLSRLAASLARHLINPWVDVIQTEDRPGGRTLTDQLDYRESRKLQEAGQGSFAERWLDDGPITDIRVQRPSDGDIQQMQKAFETCPCAFSKALSHEIAKLDAATEEYKPALDASALRSAQDDD